MLLAYLLHCAAGCPCDAAVISHVPCAVVVTGLLLSLRCYYLFVAVVPLLLLASLPHFADNVPVLLLSLCRCCLCAAVVSAVLLLSL